FFYNLIFNFSQFNFFFLQIQINIIFLLNSFLQKSQFCPFNCYFYFTLQNYIIFIIQFFIFYFIFLINPFLQLIFVLILFINLFCYLLYYLYFILLVDFAQNLIIFFKSVMLLFQLIHQIMIVFCILTDLTIILSQDIFYIIYMQFIEIKKVLIFLVRIQQLLIKVSQIHKGVYRNEILAQVILLVNQRNPFFLKNRQIIFAEFIFLTKIGKQLLLFQSFNLLQTTLYFFKRLFFQKTSFLSKKFSDFKICSQYSCLFKFFSIKRFWFIYICIFSNSVYSFLLGYSIFIYMNLIRFKNLLQKQSFLQEKSYVSYIFCIQYNNSDIIFKWSSSFSSFTISMQELIELFSTYQRKKVYSSGKNIDKLFFKKEQERIHQIIEFIIFKKIYQLLRSLAYISRIQIRLLEEEIGFWKFRYQERKKERFYFKNISFFFDYKNINSIYSQQFKNFKIRKAFSQFLSYFKGEQASFFNNLKAVFNKQFLICKFSQRVIISWLWFWRIYRVVKRNFLVILMNYFFIFKASFCLYFPQNLLTKCTQYDISSSSFVIWFISCLYVRALWQNCVLWSLYNGLFLEYYLYSFYIFSPFKFQQQLILKSSQLSLIISFEKDMSNYFCIQIKIRLKID
ncbi:hypothetical protein IMG5_171400, partial [Ichthyophthirius multifiliis]